MDQIIDALSDGSEVNSDSDSSESQGKINNPMQGSISVANIDMSEEWVFSYALKNEQDNSFANKVGSDSSKLRSNKIDLVDKYFLDNKTGFILLQDDMFNYIGPD